MKKERWIRIFWAVVIGAIMAIGVGVGLATIPDANPVSIPVSIVAMAMALCFLLATYEVMIDLFEEKSIATNLAVGISLVGIVLISALRTLSV